MFRKKSIKNKCGCICNNLIHSTASLSSIAWSSSCDITTEIADTALRFHIFIITHTLYYIHYIHQFQKIWFPVGAIIMHDYEAYTMDGKQRKGKTFSFIFVFLRTSYQCGFLQILNDSTSYLHIFSNHYTNKQFINFSF